MNFVDLKAAVVSYTARDDFPFTTLVQLAESRFASTILHRLAEVVAVLPVAAGAAPLPADFQSARSLKINGTPLTLVSIDDTVTTGGYQIVGSTIRFTSPVVGDAVLTYYARVPALGEATPSNWLLATFPDVYLYAVLVEFANWAQDPEKQSQYGTLAAVAIANLRADHFKGSFSGATLQARRFP